MINKALEALSSKSNKSLISAGSDVLDPKAPEQIGFVSVLELAVRADPEQFDIFVVELSLGEVEVEEKRAFLVCISNMLHTINSSRADRSRFCHSSESTISLF